MLFTEVETELKGQMEVVKAAGSCLPWEEVQGAETTQGEPVVRHVCRRTSH